MKPYKHQTKIADEAYEVLGKAGLVYLAMEERTGKTLTSILVAEMSKAKKILIITKKKALEGWEDTLDKFNTTKNYTYINYESLHKLNDTNFDLAIIDEAHANLSAYPKIGKTWKTVYKFVKDIPIIYLSATPSAQTYSQLFHQLKLCKYSPWAHYPSFYIWFKEYGIENIIWLGGRQVKQYNECKVRAYEDVKHLFISYTRKELGFEHEPNDIIHFVKLGEESRGLYNELNKSSIIKSLDYVADTPMKLLMGLHQIEGSTLKTEETESINLKGLEKIDYIKKEFGDVSSLVIFYHYKQEEKLLQANFKQARILQATSFAEGVDLSMYKTLVVYSMDFSTARYTQRRARQCNMKRGEAIDVHFLLVEGGISEQVYNTVAINKSNFVNKYFDKSEI